MAELTREALSAERLRGRLATLDPSKLTLVVPTKDLRDALERLRVAEESVERLEFEAKQRLLFEPKEGAHVS